MASFHASFSRGGDLESRDRFFIFVRQLVVVRPQLRLKAERGQLERRRARARWPSLSFFPTLLLFNLPRHHPFCAPTRQSNLLQHVFEIIQFLDARVDLLLALIRLRCSEASIMLVLPFLSSTCT